MNISIKKIKVRKRIRKEMGDLSNLVESIKANGLLNPIIINDKYELLAGYRRLRAVKRLGWKTVEVKIVNVKDKLSKLNIELDENMSRKDFTPMELQQGLNLKHELQRLEKMSPIKRFFYRLIKGIMGFFYRILNIEEY